MFTLKKHYYILAIIFFALTMTHGLSFASDKSYSFSVPPFPPFNGIDEFTQCKGIGALAVEKVTTKLKEDFNVIGFPYARMLNSLKTGQLDVALLFKNNTVIEDVEYIGPISISKVLIITQPNINIKHYNDLYQLDSIAVIRNAQFNKQFDQDSKLNKVNVTSYSQAVRLFKLSRINAIVGSQVGLEYALYQENIEDDLVNDALVNDELMDNAYFLGNKESGLHISKKSTLIDILPLIRVAVDEAYQENLFEQLYSQQMTQCAAL